MIAADIDEIERSVAELDGLLVVDHLIRHHDIGEQRVLLLQFEQALLGAPLRDEGRAEILERLAAGDVIVMVVAVDHVFDRLVGDGLDGVDIGLGRTLVGNRVGGDDALGCHDKHRLMPAIAEDVDIVGAVDFFRRNRWRVLCGGGACANHQNCKGRHGV
jgi:hypothetical protein